MWDLSSTHPPRLYIDNRNFEFFHSTNILNAKQARCREILSKFYRVIPYQPSALSGKADARFRRTEPAPQGGSDTWILMFKPTHLAGVEITISPLVEILVDLSEVPA